ncbi:hypothetical protein CCZ20_26390 [Priestia aryabhattai]|uniref:hypothetical protein n=1 Tax=Priestia aryabhattai TaxID=412384 RepID=UPI000B50C585|nr:hypothetical protein [Priestia aryabhattai]OVE34475.1 hypothetical protein CCZ20_26390 [Priestia aryabhattai]
MLENKVITMVEAYEIGIQKCIKLDENCELIYIGSVDDQKDTGIDGKKGDWQMILALNDKKKKMIVKIERGHVKDTSLLEGVDEPTIKSNEIKIDSSDAIKEVVNKFSLSPGQTNLYRGYHFRLFKENETLFLSVIGNKKIQDTEIFIDGKTGKYLGRTEVQ